MKNILIKMDQVLVTLPLYKLVPKTGWGNEVHCRKTQTIELKKGDVISQNLVKRWKVIKIGWVITGIEDYDVELPECCRLTIAPINREIEEVYEVLPKTIIE